LPTFDLQNLLDTVILAKTKIFNTKILNENEIKEIYNHDKQSVVLSDLMDISTFKILFNNDLLAVYIKYPKINGKCDLYKTRAIAQSDGKLLINNEVANCKNKYYLMTNFKKDMFHNYCKLSFETNCFIKLLNGEKANCSKIREINKKPDILQDGAILITGTNLFICTL